MDSRTTNAKRNIIFGVFNKLVSLVLPFLTRTAILYLLGSTFLGIGTLFSSILSFLSLAELGFGSAIVFSMYRPIAEGDNKTIGALLLYYKKLYRIIGIIILTVGTMIVPCVPSLMNGEAPSGLNVYVLYYLYLINSVIGYFFQGYKQSLLSAYQRTDIINNIATAANVFVQLVQILTLYFFRNFYLYAIVPVLGTLITNFINAYIVKQKYPQIKCEGSVDKKIRKGIKNKIFGLLGTKLNSIVVHSVDIMIISKFLGLTSTAKYGNYYYIMSSVSGLLAVVHGSLIAGIGNKIVSDSLDETFCLFKKLSFINYWFVGFCSICFLCIYEPFLSVWAGDDMTFGLSFAILMSIYFFIYEIQRTVLTFKDAAGLWNKDKFRPYISMIVNLVSNVVLVQVIGIYGIILSTILAFVISLPWANTVLFHNLFHKKSIPNIMSMILQFLITIIAAVPTYLLCTLIRISWGGIIIRLLICMIVVNMIFLMFNIKNKEFKNVINFILKSREVKHNEHS